MRNIPARQARRYIELDKASLAHPRATDSPGRNSLTQGGLDVAAIDSDDMGGGPL